MDGLKVNLIDTPGHADFISEVEHALSVLDGVILVISAVEGVQAQTRVLMQTLKELRIPTLLFMNKIDRRGANYGQVRTRIQNLLDPHICDMTVTENEGSENAGVRPADPVSAGWLETLALQDDELLRMYAEDIPVSADRLYEELIRQTRAGKAFPLFSRFSGQRHWRRSAAVPSGRFHSDKRIGRVFKCRRSSSAVGVRV